MKFSNPGGEVIEDQRGGLDDSCRYKKQNEAKIREKEQRLHTIHHQLLHPLSGWDPACCLQRQMQNSMEVVSAL